MGYTIDRDYYQKNRSHKKMAAGCILLIIFGFTVRAFGALHKQKEWDRMTRELNDLQKMEVERRPKFASGEEYLAYLRQADRDRRERRKKIRENVAAETEDADWKNVFM